MGLRQRRIATAAQAAKHVNGSLLDTQLYCLGKKLAPAAIDEAIFPSIVCRMKGKFTAIIEEAPEGGYWAICPEVPGANGQGDTVTEAKRSLRDAIRLIFADRVADARRGLPKEPIQAVIAV